MQQNVLARLVQSKRGRDKGRCFIIIGILDDNHVIIADGDLRKLSRPKKKKLKHLKIFPQIAEEIKAKLEGDGRISDKEVRSILERFKSIISKPVKEDTACQSKT